jgi:uncharacterized phage infection (PIP) family protein YhgE
MVAVDNLVNIVVRAKDQASAVVNRAGSSLSRLNATIQAHSRQFLLAGAAIVGALGLMTKGAEEQRRTQDLLASSLANINESYEELGPRIEENIAQIQAQTAVSDELQREALAQLIAQLGSTEKAMAALPAAIDLAATAKKKLTSVVKVLGPALAGATNTVSALGIVYDSTADFGERLADITDRVSGAAAAAATPSAKLKANFADLSDTIGTALLPLFDDLNNLLSKASRFVADADPVWVSFGAKVGLLSGALLILLGVLPKLVVGFGLLKAATLFLTTTPWGLAITAIGALAGAFFAFTGSAEETVEPAKKAADALDSVVDSAVEAGDAVEDLPSRLDGLTQFADDLPDLSAKIRAGIDELRDVLQAGLAEAQDIPTGEAVTGAIVDALEVLPSLIDPLLDEAGQVVQARGRVLFGALPDAAREAVSETIATFLEEIGFRTSDIAQAGGDITEALSGALARAGPEAEEQLAVLRRAIRDEFELVGNDIEPVLAAIEALPSDAIQGATEAAGRPLADLASALADGTAEAASVSMDGFDTLADVFSVGATDAVAAGIDPWADLQPAVADELARIPPAVQDTAHDLVSFLQSSEWTGITGLIANPMIEGFGGALQSLDSFTSQALALLQSILAALSNTSDAFEQFQNQTGGGGSPFGPPGFTDSSNFQFGQIGALFTQGDRDFIVGETGPERVRLPRGSRIFNARETEEMAVGGFDRSSRIDTILRREERLIERQEDAGAQSVTLYNPQFVFPSVVSAEDVESIVDLLTGEGRV